MNLDINTAKIIGFLLIIPFAVLMDGVRRKAVARMQNRVGPPIWQPFFDLIKLYQKKSSDSLAEKNVFFKIIPPLYLITTLALFVFIPLKVVSFKYDFLLLVYLLALESALFVLAAFASNSPFGVIASMRELTLMVCYETIFAIVILTLFIFNNITSLAGLTQSWQLIKLPIAAVCFFYVMLTETRTTPYDTVEASPEIMAGAESEFSGKGLMFLELAKMMKLTFFAMLSVALFFGYFNLLAFLSLTILIVLALGFWHATTCRYKVDQAFNKLIFVFIFALIEFIRIRFIVW
ncbi:NADH-quinone oxidoreductase subunit H [Candidatus Woesearchaeota archaeon]|nr:NADH-quinone oxidoreductase subunit H [Candidatus Woesearchaeota archaeon]